MNILVEKKPIVGTLKTLVGTFNLLDLTGTRFHNLLSPSLRDVGGIVFQGINDEGFETPIVVRGNDFVIVPSVVPAYVDVKRVMTEEEVSKLPKTDYSALPLSAD